MFKYFPGHTGTDTGQAPKNRDPVIESDLEVSKVYVNTSLKDSCLTVSRQGFSTTTFLFNFLF